MRTVSFPDGAAVPALGQGTWKMGEDPARRAAEVAALRAGVDLGMTLIDTAEMYGEGAAEALVGEALAGVRAQVFLVSKAYPQNAGRRRLTAACEASLRRLRAERLDLYLLHWRGSTPLAETAEAMEALVAAGKIARWGVSNLDAEDMDELWAAGGSRCAADQILYNLEARGPEFDLMPRLRVRAVPVMAYSPLGQGALAAAPALDAPARRRGTTPAAIALAWTLRRDDVIAIPKASDPGHVAANRRAGEIVLEPDELAALDRAFPPPTGPTPLAML